MWDSDVDVVGARRWRVLCQTVMCPFPTRADAVQAMLPMWLIEFFDPRRFSLPLRLGAQYIAQHASSAKALMYYSPSSKDYYPTPWVATDIDLLLADTTKHHPALEIWLCTASRSAHCVVIRDSFMDMISSAASTITKCSWTWNLPFPAWPSAHQGRTCASDNCADCWT